MRRDALRGFLRGAALASLPLGAGCSNCPPPHQCYAPKFGVVAAPSTSFTDGGFNEATCAEICAPLTPDGYPADSFRYCIPDLPDGGPPTVECYFGTCVYGVYTCEAAPTEPGVAPVTAALRAAAHAEARSVAHLQRLARDLHRHGAPPTLVKAITSAARDEARHALIFSSLTRAPEIAGATPSHVTTIRSLEAIALDNAIGGRTLETWSAVQIAWQSRHASPSLRGAFAEVAADELRHARLARAIEEWIVPRLGRTARARMIDERSRALVELAPSVIRAGRFAPRALGLPPPEVARDLFERVARS
jgi:hypothetical protein